MAAAHAIIQAYEAIKKANRVLKASGMTPAKVPASEFVFAERLAAAEVTTCLREPARQLVTLIAKRAGLLAEEAAVRAELDANATWGMF